jgi:putative tryptophan/tyrosine transport system substrate-binding protein
VATIPTRIAKDMTSSLPIVFGAVLDPVGNGIVANLTRPEGNLTGIEYLVATIPKLIELAKELSPQTKAIAHLFEPAARGSERSGELADASDTARRLGLTYRAFPISAVEDISRTLDTAVGEGFDTFIVDNVGLLQFHRWSIARQAIDRRMKAIGREREFAAIGGLASFGEESLTLYRRMASHVDKILKGTPVAEIPVEQAAKWELVVNQKTAKILGLTIPTHLLARADEVIE